MPRPGPIRREVSLGGSPAVGGVVDIGPPEIARAVTFWRAGGCDPGETGLGQRPPVSVAIGRVRRVRGNLPAVGKSARAGGLDAVLNLLALAISILDEELDAALRAFADVIADEG